MQVKGKIIVDVSKTSSRLKVKYRYGSIALDLEKYLLFWQ